MTAMQQLTDADLDRVSGGSDPNYKFCANGPAGSGLYPNYVDCRSNFEILMDAFKKGVEQGIRNAGGKPA